MELHISQQMFEKFSYIKFHENPSSGSRVFPCGQTGRHDEKIVACRNFANALEKRFKRKYKFDAWVGFLGLGLGSIGVLLWV